MAVTTALSDGLSNNGRALAPVAWTHGDRLPGVHEGHDVIARSPLTGSEVGHLTLQAGLSLLNLLDEVAVQVGLQASDLRAMYLLRIVGELSAGELARRVLVPQSCVTLIAKRLEAEEFLVRRRHHVDGRKVVLSLTSAGERAIDEYAVLVRSRMREFFAPLSAASAAALAALLGEVVEPAGTQPV